MENSIIGRGEVSNVKFYNSKKYSLFQLYTTFWGHKIINIFQNVPFWAILRYLDGWGFPKVKKISIHKLFFKKFLQVILSVCWKSSQMILCGNHDNNVTYLNFLAILRQGLHLFLYWESQGVGEGESTSPIWSRQSYCCVVNMPSWKRGYILIYFSFLLNLVLSF